MREQPTTDHKMAMRHSTRKSSSSLDVMRSFFRFAHRGLVFFTLLIFALLLLIFFLLRSNNFNQQALTWLKPQLLQAGFDVKHVEHISIDLLGHVNIRGLSLQKVNKKQNQNDATLKLDINKFAAHYTISSLLGGTLVIDSLELDGLDLTLQQLLGVSSAEEEEPSPDSFTLKKLELFLSDPSVPVIVKDLQLKNLNLDLQFLDEDQEIHIKQKVNLSSTLFWDKNQLVGTAEFEIRPVTSLNKKALELIRNIHHEPLKLSLNPGFENRLKWQLTYNTNPWNLKVETSTQQLDLDSIQFQQQTKSGTIFLGMDSFIVDIDSHIASVSSEHSKKSGFSSVFPLKIKSALHSKGKLKTRKVGDDSFNITANHDFQLSFNQLLNSPEELVNQLSLNSELQLHLDDTRIDQTHLKTQAESVKLNLKTLVQRGNINEPLSLKNDVEITATTVDHQQNLNTPKGQSLGDVSAIGLHFKPMLKLSVDASVDNPETFLNSKSIELQQLLALTNARIELNTGIEQALGTLTYDNGAQEKLTIQKQQLQIKVKSDKGQMSLHEKLNVQQLNTPSLQQPLNISQIFYLEGTTRQLHELQFDGFGNISTSHVDIKRTLDDQKEPLIVQATPDFSFTARGRLSNLQNIGQKLPAIEMHFNQLLKISDLSLSLPQTNAEALKISSRSDSFFVVGDIKPNRYDISSKISSEQLVLPQLEKPVDLDQSISLEGDMQGMHSIIGLNTRLDAQPLFMIDLPISNKPGGLNLQPHVSVHFNKNLGQLHPMVTKALNEMGEGTAVLTGDTTLNHDSNSVLELDIGNQMNWPFTSAGKLKVIQTSNVENSKLQLHSPLEVDYSISRNLNQKFSATLDLHNMTFLYPPIEKPTEISANLKNDFSWPLDTTTAEGTINFSHNQLLDYQLTISDKPKNLTIKSHWRLDSSTKLLRSLSKLEPLKLTGATTLDFDLNANVDHPYASLSTKMGEDMNIDTLLPALNGEINIQGKLSQSAKQRGSLLKIYRPVNFTQNLNLRGNKFTVSGQLQAPSLKFEEQFSAKSLDLNFYSTMSPAKQPTSLQLKAQLKFAQLTLPARKGSNEKPMDITHLVTPLKLSLSSTFDKSFRHFTLDSFHLNSADSLLDVTASGSGSPQSRDGQVELLIKSQLKPKIWLQPLFSGSGELKLPLDLTILDGTRVTLGGELQLEHLSLAGKSWSMNDIKGRIGIDEELRITPQQRLAFLYTLDTDPFQRVDYARIQPFLDGHSQFSISSINVDETEVGPLSASLDVRQNLINLQKLNLDILGGHLAGEIYIDTNPEGWKFGLLGRLNNIRLDELLQASSRLKDLEQSPVNARVAIEYDLNLYLLEGRIDISDISVLQLMQLLELMDPEYQDEQLSQIRSVLSIARPRWVSIDMRRGLIDLEVALSSLPTTIKIHALPLTPLLRRFTEIYLRQLQKLPLERSESGQLNTGNVKSATTPEDN